MKGPIAIGIAADVIAWQQVHGRNDLPWQRPDPGRQPLRDPYRVWLSEVMLQQTQVATVIPYFGAFVAAFPTVLDLADAPPERVMSLWSGLGYYSRARNLQAAARRIVERHEGRFPADPAALEDLPGVGRSTAAAIAVFGFGVRAAILDGNVKRVFSRLFAIDGFPGEAAVARRLWAHANAELPPIGTSAAALGRYTQGLMDLGATCCARTGPDCGRCPLSVKCGARLRAEISRFPAARPRRAVPERPAHLLLIRRNGAVLLEERPPSGIWGGLWSLPEVSLDTAGRPADLPYGLDPAALRAHGGFDHAFTHFRMRATIWSTAADPVPFGAAPVDAEGRARPARWLALADVATAPLPQPIKRLLTGLQEQALESS